jgi:hypothetical protein
VSGNGHLCLPCAVIHPVALHGTWQITSNASGSLFCTPHGSTANLDRMVKCNTMCERPSALAWHAVNALQGLPSASLAKSACQRQIVSTNSLAPICLRPGHAALCL